MAEEETLRKVDAKLGALLAIAVDQYLRDTGVARPRARSIDKLLSDSGLSPQQIASLLGKTDRAVNLQLASERKGKTTRSGKTQGEKPTQASPEEEV
jgi:hypothetical protein